MTSHQSAILLADKHPGAIEDAAALPRAASGQVQRARVTLRAYLPVSCARA